MGSRAGRFADAGVVAVRQGVPVGFAIDELELFVSASDDGEWDGQVLFIAGG